MRYIQLRSPSGRRIKFRLCTRKASITCLAFIKALPLSARAVHARFAGEEVYIPAGPVLRVPYENATLRPKRGELGYAPTCARSSVARSIAFVYGKAQFSERVNIFAQVVRADRSKLEKLGREIWLKGSRIFRLEALDPT